MEGVYCAVRTGSLNKAVCASYLKGYFTVIMCRKFVKLALKTQLNDKILYFVSFQSIVMLMFREEKSPEDEIKAWQFWHGRQHSVKQRILDAGKLNSSLCATYTELK